MWAYIHLAAGGAPADGPSPQTNAPRARSTLNKNSVPGDKSAMVPGGMRIGTPALTTRGFQEADFEKVAEFIHRAVEIAKDCQVGHPGAGVCNPGEQGAPWSQISRCPDRPAPPRRPSAGRLAPGGGPALALRPPHMLASARSRTSTQHAPPPKHTHPQAKTPAPGKLKEFKAYLEAEGPKRQDIKQLREEVEALASSFPMPGV